MLSAAGDPRDASSSRPCLALSPPVLRECVEACRDNGFMATPYPVILTLENHTSESGQVWWTMPRIRQSPTFWAACKAGRLVRNAFYILFRVPCLGLHARPAGWSVMCTVFYMQGAMPPAACKADE